MERQEIYQLIAEAKLALRATTEYAADSKTVVTAKAQAQYLKDARRIYGVDNSNKLSHPVEASTIIASVRKAKTKSTLRKYARSVRHIALAMMKQVLRDADKYQRSANWEDVERLVSSQQFSALVQICKMMPADYAQNWAPERKRKGKKASLARLPTNWREQMLTLSKGQYRLSMLVCMLTGCRPHEVEKGIVFKKSGSVLAVHIRGAKVTEYAGQEYRMFKLPDNELKAELLEMLRFDEKGVAVVKVKHGNSITTHMRKLGQSLWPRRKESITVYTARHAMAAACKQAIFEGAEPDLASKILGHIVDKTLSYYGNRYQAGGVNIVPTAVKVPKGVHHKSKERNIARRSNNKVPSRKSKFKFQPSF